MHIESKNFKPFPFCSLRKCSTANLQRTEKLSFDKSYACKLFLTERNAWEIRNDSIRHNLRLLRMCRATQFYRQNIVRIRSDCLSGSRLR